MSGEQSARWSVHRATADDDDELLNLFEQVFGQPMPLAQWRWKYSESPVRGILLRREKMAVAFFGGMPRSLQGPLGAVAAVQNGDVMVLPSERGVFSRQGALYRAAFAFFEQLVGPGKLYEFAFGFPSERHFRLGVKLDLYQDSGRLVELSWSAKHAETRFLTATSCLEALEIDSVVGNLWPRMQRSWPNHFIPKRDPERWAFRFAAHPVHRYDLLVVHRRFLRKPLCALVLREHAGHIEWLDFVGSAETASLAISVARHFASEHQNKPVMALFSQSIASAFSENATSVLSNICMPVNMRPPHEHRPYVNNLWCMGGDTDFL